MDVEKQYFLAPRIFTFFRSKSFYEHSSKVAVIKTILLDQKFKVSYQKTIMRSIVLIRVRYNSTIVAIFCCCYHYYYYYTYGQQLFVGDTRGGLLHMINNFSSLETMQSKTFLLRLNVENVSDHRYRSIRTPCGTWSWSTSFSNKRSILTLC